MNKYVAIYRVPVATAEEWRKNTDQEAMKKQGQKMMEDMTAWMKAHESSFVERGNPLGKTKTVTKDGVKDARNDLNFYQIIQANSHEEAAAIFLDCPHLQIPTSSIDIMEIPHMGM